MMGITSSTRLLLRGMTSSFSCAITAGTVRRKIKKPYLRALGNIKGNIGMKEGFLVSRKPQNLIRQAKQN
jgi:hypothetical protein